MPAFEYIALDAKGKQEKGILEADTARQLRQLLRDSGMMLLEVNEVAGGKHEKEGKIKVSGRLKPAELSLVTRQLATLVQSGSPLEEALATTAKQTDRKNIKRVMSAVRSKVMEGHSLANGLGLFPKVFPEIYRATVAAGEQSGHLDAVLERLADYTENRQIMQQKVTNAMMYPLILTVLSIAILAGLLGYVVPKVVTVFDNMDQELPLLTRVLIDASDFIRDYGLFMAIAVVIIIALLKKLLAIPHWRYRYHQMLLKIPLIGKLNQGFNTARFARTLETMFTAGVPLVEAMTSVAGATGNIIYSEATLRIRDDIATGQQLQLAMHQTELFPNMVVQMVAIGEESGSIDTMLGKVADFYEEEVDDAIDALSSLLEPLIMSFLGVVVGGLVVAMYLPIFKMGSVI